jgi:hypothetical protein
MALVGVTRRIWLARLTGLPVDSLRACSPRRRYCNTRGLPYAPFSYIRKITWTYDNNIIITIDSSTKGRIYNPAWSYEGSSPEGTAGGVGHRTYYLWMAGMFSKDLGDGMWKEASLNIAMQILYDGTYWKWGWWYTEIIPPI